jgi:5-methylcytosine-specific restriction endonuclease McrA
MNIPHEYLELAQEIRREILHEGTRGSIYNSALKVKECEICKCSIKTMLEVHHITQQKDANKDGFLPDGSHKDSISNLIVLCSKCHDEYHAGKLIIGKTKQTSNGELRTITQIDTPKKISKWKNEE